MFGFTTNFFLKKLNVIQITYILKLFNIYIIEKNKLNEFKETYKNNLLILNLFLIFLHFFFSSTFPLHFLSLTFFLKFSRNQTLPKCMIVSKTLN